MIADPDVGKLVSFGLTVLQAKVYVALLRIGTTRASRISSLMGLIRPEVYRILRELSLKGLVQLNPGSPSTFTPTPPERVVEILLAQYTNRLMTMTENKTELIRSLSSHISNTSDAPEERFSLITGRDNVLLQNKRMLADAKQDYIGIMSTYGLKRLRDDGFASVLLAAKRRKVRVRIITEIDRSNVQNANYMSRHVEIRKAAAIQFYIDIVDKREMVFGPSVTDEEADERILRASDVWTNNVRFIQGMYAMFERLWRVSPKYSARELD
ncbi:MAG TPA: helix-turn-helix domain-containing protein [Candidatus Bathyarchaeia archaeon]|nr:helix-turn-helix domain-containing protein [Candidatus Bathyarchaeia archaeon]